MPTQSLKILILGAPHSGKRHYLADLLLEVLRHKEWGLADPVASTLYGWGPEGYVATDGPYAEAKEQLAGFFIVDCTSRERAEELARRFAHPGAVVELRPVMWPGVEDQ